MAKYGYQYRNGGFVGFEGSSADTKAVERITAELTDEDRVTVTTEYIDGNIRRLECGFECTDDSVILSEVKKFWNDEIMT